MPASPFGNPAAYTVAPQFAQQMYPSGYDPHQAGFPGQPAPMERFAPQSNPADFFANHPGIQPGSFMEMMRQRFPHMASLGGGNFSQNFQPHGAQPGVPGNTGIVPPNMQPPQMQPPQAPQPRPMQAAVMPQPQIGGGFNFLTGRRPGQVIAR